LAFILFHAAMWLLQTPQAAILQFRGKRLPDFAVATGGFTVCLLASLGVAWILAGGR